MHKQQCTCHWPPDGVPALSVLTHCGAQRSLWLAQGHTGRSSRPALVWPGTVVLVGGAGAPASSGCPRLHWYRCRLVQVSVCCDAVTDPRSHRDLRTAQTCYGAVWGQKSEMDCIAVGSHGGFLALRLRPYSTPWLSATSAFRASSVAPPRPSLIPALLLTHEDL